MLLHTALCASFHRKVSTIKGIKAFRSSMIAWKDRSDGFIASLRCTIQLDICCNEISNCACSWTGWNSLSLHRDSRTGVVVGKKVNGDTRGKVINLNGFEAWLKTGPDTPGYLRDRTIMSVTVHSREIDESFLIIKGQKSGVERTTVLRISKSDSWICKWSELKMRHEWLNACLWKFFSCE